MRHGSHIDPPNRFERLHRDANPVHADCEQEFLAGEPHRKIEYLEDTSKSIISENNSPDIPFRYSLNPYRGCIHGCAYCYARPTHEYLGFSAGLDFETKIIVKRNAPQLFREFLSRESWQVQPIIFSGVTDCYQPAEREFRLTRGCVEVAAECRQPIGIITKNALVARDLDLLKIMADQRLLNVAVSITTLDRKLASSMEPRTSTPEARLRTMEQLADAGVPVQLMLAPILVGLNDTEIPAILKAARQAGATAAGYQLLRLPLNVLPVFQEWLERTQPLKADAVMSKIRSTRDGKSSDSKFGRRMTGQGVIADSVRNTFEVFCKKLGYASQLPARDTTSFQRPQPSSGQLRLF